MRPAGHQLRQRNLLNVLLHQKESEISHFALSSLSHQFWIFHFSCTVIHSDTVWWGRLRKILKKPSTSVFLPDVVLHNQSGGRVNYRHKVRKSYSMA